MLAQLAAMQQALINNQIYRDQQSLMLRLGKSWLEAGALSTEWS